jgi:hypothetical protein
MGAQNTVVGHLLTQDGTTWTLSVWKWWDIIFFTVTLTRYGDCHGMVQAKVPSVNTLNRCGAVVVKHYATINKDTLDQVTQWIQDIGWTLIHNQ